MTDDLFSMSGKTVLVTGGSRGLGRSMVWALARAGADVVVASRKLDACQALADEVAAVTGRRLWAKAVHVGHWDELEPFVDEVYDEVGPLDVLINNAGMSPLYGELVDVTEQLFDTVIGINQKGPFRLTALVGTRMKARGRGSVINISSVGSIRPYAGIVPYAGAKAALNAMTVGFSRAFGPEVRVNCIMPGTFRTDVADSWDLDAMQSSFDAFSLKRIGEPDEIIGAVLWLASDASSYTTGAVFPVDGGIP